MQNKIIEALHPDLLKELNSKKELLEKNEKFVEENELTEERDVMIELMVSKNIVKRLREEIPKLADKEREVRRQSSAIENEYREAKEAEKILKSLKKANEALELDSNYLTKRTFKRGIIEFKIMDIKYDIVSAIEKMENIIFKNEMNKKRFPTLKGVI